MSLRTFPLSSIRIPENRQRRSMADAEVEALALSIKDNSLLHPPVVRLEGGSGTPSPVLVAGRRRLAAIERLGNRRVPIRFGTSEYNLQGVPVVLLSEAPVGEIKAKEIELDENLRRVDLTWQERTDAIAELAALRKAQVDSGDRPPFTGTQLAVAKELGISQPEVAKHTFVAAHLSDPNVARQASFDAAYKVALKKAEDTFLSRLPIPSSTKHRLLSGDCFELLETKEYEGLFDCIITDPPYGVDADAWQGTSSLLAHGYEDKSDTFSPMMSRFARLSFSISKPQSHLFLFFDSRQWNTVATAMQGGGWWVWRRPLIWHKPGSGIITHPDITPKNSYEMVLFCVKGEKKLRSPFSDVLSFPSPSNKVHAAQKPVELYELFLRHTCLPGAIVCDPFAGSGTIFPAATAAACTAIGCEKDEAMVVSARARLSSGKEKKEIQL